MSKHSGELNLLGHWTKLRDVLLVGTIILVILTSLIGGILRFSPLDTGQSTLIIVGSILVLLAALTGYNVAMMIDMDKEYGEMREQFRSAVPSQVLKSHRLVYSTASELIRDAKSTIWATQFGLPSDFGHGPDEYSISLDKYLHELADTLTQSKRTEEPISYRVIFGYRDGDPRLAYDEMAKRLAKFKDADVDKLFDYRFATIQWGLDLLIVDDRHLLIAFPTSASDRRLR